MTTFNIRAYESAPAHLPKRTEPPRKLTAHERWLDTFAQRDGIAGNVTIWHQQADGTFSSFEVVLPDAGVMAVIGTTHAAQASDGD